MALPRPRRSHRRRRDAPDDDEHHRPPRPTGSSPTQVKSALAINGIIGTWAGPDEPGTAYVMAHHSIGDVGDGHLGRVGLSEGGMGAVADAIRSSAEAFGCEVRTDAPVDKDPRVRRARARACVLKDGEELRAPTRGRRDPSEDHVPASDRPPRAARRLRARHRALADPQRRGEGERRARRSLPDFIADPGTEPQPHHSGSVELALSTRDTSSRRSRMPQEGRAPSGRSSTACIPSTLDQTLAPEGMHIMSLFTQWVPHEWSEEPHAEELEAYADRVDRRVHRAGAQLQAVDHRTVR